MPGHSRQIFKMALKIPILWFACLYNPFPLMWAGPVNIMECYFYVYVTNQLSLRVKGRDYLGWALHSRMSPVKESETSETYSLDDHKKAANSSAVTRPGNRRPLVVKRESLLIANKKMGMSVIQHIINSAKNSNESLRDWISDKMAVPVPANSLISVF